MSPTPWAKNSAPLTLRKRLDKLGFREMNNWIPSNYANAYTLSLWQEVAALLIINGQAGYFHDV